MRLDKTENVIEYESRRLFPGPRPAEFSVKYEIGESVGPAKPGTLEHFFAERYILYAQTRSGLSIGRVHHVNYPLHEVRIVAWSESMMAAAGLSRLNDEPLALYSPAVDVDIYALTKVV